MCLVAAVPRAAGAETLIDAIGLAYRSNPSLRAQQAQLRSTDETYVQAKAGYGPQVSVNGQVDYQAARVQEPPSFFTPKTTTDYLAGNASADLSIVQPLYTNGQVTAQVRAAAADVRSGRQDLRQMEAQVLLNVVTAYMDVLRDRRIIGILKDEIDALQADVAEQEAKGKLGVSSKTDVAQSQARLLATQAQLSQAQGQATTSAAEYLAVVGQSPGDLAPAPELPNVPTDVDGAFDAADKGNPQLLASVEAEDAARQRVTQAKAANGPTVAFRVDAAIAPVESFVPQEYDKSVTAAVVFNQPIFTSGAAASKVREAADDDTRAALQVEATRRAVDQQVTQTWANLIASEASAALQQRQVGVEEIAVQGNRLEERAGLRTAIDLLNAEAELAQNRQGLAAAEHDVYVAKATLLATMGFLEARYLIPGVVTYDPVRAFKRVENINAPAIEAISQTLDRQAPVSTAPPSIPPSGDTQPKHP